MPYKPAKPCAFPGCPRLTNSRYCEEHTRVENQRYERYGRDPETRRRYGHTWEKIRKRYVTAHPYCEECFKRGVMTPVEHVHHVLPLSEGGTHEESNLMALCKPCHSKLHAERGDRWHNGNKKSDGRASE